MRHYAEYYTPGSFEPEVSSKELENYSVAEAVANAPLHAFAFMLYDLATDIPESTSVYRVIPLRQNKSHRYYLGGEVFTREQIGEIFGYKSILYSNMGNDGWDPVVKCRTGNYQPLMDGEIIPVM